MKGYDIVIYLMITIFMLILTLLYIKYAKKVEPFENLYKTQSKFTQSQGNYFGDKLNKSLMTNKGLDEEMSTLNKVLFNVDVLASKNSLPGLPPFSSDEDPFPELEERNKKECEPMTSPKDMSLNGPDKYISCGWWYYDNEDKQGLATLGTVNGPLNENFSKDNPGGLWVWNKEEAQKKEDVKNCRKIRSCETADVQPNCGFCLDKSIGIPVSNGKSKYINDPNLSCEQVVVDPKKCPPPESVQITKTIYTDDGKTLKSGDLYNGEVIPFDTALLSDVCALNPKTGSISKDCLLSLIRTLGYTDNGVISKILMGDKEGYYTRIGENYDFYQMSKAILKQDAGFDLKGELVGDGRIRKQDAISLYKIIINYAKNSNDRRVKNACMWLVYGTEYDPCDYDPKKKGPFHIYCLERVALESGCQRDGFSFPNVNTRDNFNGFKWNEVIKYFKELFESMRNKTDTTQQKRNIIDCLGITTATDLSTLCAYKGEKCKIQTEEDLFKSPYISKSKANEAFYLNKAKIVTSPIEKQLAEEMAEESKKQTAKTLAILRSINKKGCPPGPPIASWDFNKRRPDDRLRKYKSNYVGCKPKSNVIFYSECNFGGRATQLPVGEYPFNKLIAMGYNNDTLQSVKVPKGLAVIMWEQDIGGGREVKLTADNACLKDINYANTVSSCHVINDSSEHIVDMCLGKYGASFVGRDTYVKIKGPISTRDFKTITMMVYIKKFTGGSPRLWELTNLAFGSSWCADQIFGCLGPDSNAGVGMYSQRNCVGPSIWALPEESKLTEKSWYHIAWAIDNDFKGMTIYINGILRNRWTSPVDDKDLKNRIFDTLYIGTSSEQIDKDIIISWFRIFDYTLDEILCKKDMENKWIMPSYKESLYI